MGAAQHRGDLTELLIDVLPVGLGEDGEDDRGADVKGSRWNHGEDLADEMHPTNLPAGALEHGPDCPLQSSVGTLHDQLDPVRPRVFSDRRNDVQKPLVLAGADVETEELAAAVNGTTERDNDCLRDDQVPDAGLAIGGVEKHIRAILRGQGAVTELCHSSSQSRADPGYFRLGYPCDRAKYFDQVIDFAGRDDVNVGLHNDRVQRLVDSSAPLQQGGKERPSAKFRELQVELPGRCRQRPRPGAVAVGGAVSGAFERRGADERGRLPIDKLLVVSFGRSRGFGR